MRRLKNETCDRVNELTVREAARRVCESQEAYYDGEAAPNGCAVVDARLLDDLKRALER